MSISHHQILYKVNLFKSHSDFFIRKGLSKEGRLQALSEDRRIVFEHLTRTWKYKAVEAYIYLQAYDYFVQNPNEFDGATLTEDMPDIPNLDLDAMLHDYLYVALNASADWDYMVKADELFKKEMYRRQKSSWNSWYRNSALYLKTPFFLFKAKHLKGRRITGEDKKELDRIFRTLSL